MNNFSQELENKINNVIVKLQTTDFSPILPVIAAIIEAKIDENFRNQGRWNGSNSNINFLSGGTSTWVERSKSTIKNYKKSKRGVTPILKRTGVLQRQIEVTTSGKTGINISVNTPYAAIQQFGGVIEIPARESSAKWNATLNKSTGNYKFRFAKKNANSKNTIERKFMKKAHKIVIPARPYITLTQDDLDEIFEVIIKYFG